MKVAVAVPIPESWGKRRGKFLFTRIKRNPALDEGVVTAFRDGQVTLRSKRREDGFTNAELEIGYQGIRVGDLVIHGMDGFAGAIGVSDSDGKASPVVHAYLSLDGNDPRYYAYLLRDLAKNGFITSLAKGIRERSTAFDSEMFKCLDLPMPTVTEQKAIADYLDRETKLIDALIEKKQQMHDLVQLRRRALVELYLGEASFPKWKFGRLLISNDGGVWGEDPAGLDDTVVLRSTDISITGDWNIDNPALRSLTQSEKRAKTLKRGDLVVVKSSGSEAHLGKTAIVNSAVADLDACYANFVQRLRPRDTKDAKFLWYFLNSDLASKELDRLGNTTTGLRNLNGESLGSIKCPWPDSKIRDTLCQELDRRIATSNSLLSALEGQIALLRERRQALITAAVTGDLEIAEVAA